jgi:UV excision repair protein RAD23
MKITIKTLQQKVFHVSFSYFLSAFDAYLVSFQVEADPADTISILKEKINADQGHPVESQKIIYSGNITFITQTALVLIRITKGKVLSDDKTIQSCEIKEKDFLVLMVSKVRFESPYLSFNIDRFSSA